MSTNFDRFRKGYFSRVGLPESDDGRKKYIDSLERFASFESHQRGVAEDELDRYKKAIEYVRVELVRAYNSNSDAYLRIEKQINQILGKEEGKNGYL